MKTSKIAALGGLLLVAALLFVFSFVLLHHEGKTNSAARELEGQFVDKLSALRLGRTMLNAARRAEHISVPNIFSLDMFNTKSSSKKGSKRRKKARKEPKQYDDDDDYYEPLSEEDDEIDDDVVSAHVEAAQSAGGGKKEKKPKKPKKRHPAAPDPKLEQSLAAAAATNKGGMTCRESYEPTCPMYSYVRFWNKRFYPEDCYTSSMRHPLGKKAPVEELKYLVFEPDRGGWNNIRMAAETAMIFAHASGRVLVMPPRMRMYLLDKDKHPEDNESTFSKFFDLSKLSESMTMISMEEFLETVAKPGLLNAPIPAKLTPKQLATVAPGSERLWKYLERACYVREWEPGKIHIGFNVTRDSSTGQPMFGHIDLKGPRVRKHASHARKLLPYDAKLHVHRAIFFPGDYRNTHRILTHFYTYLYWADRHQDAVYKRLVRDRLHYHDDIFCAAGRVVRMLHEDAAALSGGTYKVPGPDNAHPLTSGGSTERDATYFSYHIRRGDFQYSHTKLPAEQIWANTRHLLAPYMNRTSLIYIATDEKNKDFFEPFHRGFKEHGFKLVFLEDYVKRAFLADGHLNQNHLGMVEQVVCANAHTFIGTPLSTFTGYITRMRGYYRDSRYARTYYTMPEQMYQMHTQTELKGPFWAREWFLATRDIDDVMSGAKLSSK